MSAAGDLVGHIDRFLTGEDTSRSATDAMEGLVLEHFTLEEWFDDASLALAQYSPGGGEHLYDEAALAPVLRRVRQALARPWVGHHIVREALVELSDAAYQRRVWAAAEGPEVGSFEEAVCHLYDDSGLGIALDGAGDVYGPAIDGRLRELLALLRRVDGRRPPTEVIQDPLLARARGVAAAVLHDLG